MSFFLLGNGSSDVVVLDLLCGISVRCSYSLLAILSPGPAIVGYSGLFILYSLDRYTSLDKIDGDGNRFVA